MKIKSFFVVFVSFIIFLFLFLPYAKIYNYLIYKVLKRSNVSATYQVEKASLFSVKLKNVHFKVGYKKYGIKELTVRINPLFFIGSKLGSVTINGGEARFKVLKNSGSFKSFVVDGYFYTKLLKQFLDEPYAGMVSGFKGKNRLTARIKPAKNGVVLEDLTVSGKFLLKAKGYISGRGFSIRGYVKVGKVKHEFAI